MGTRGISKLSAEQRHDRAVIAALARWWKKKKPATPDEPEPDKPEKPPPLGDALPNPGTSPNGDKNLQPKTTAEARELKTSPIGDKNSRQPDSGGIRYATSTADKPLPSAARWKTEAEYQRWIKSDPVLREIYKRRRRSYIFD